MTYKTYNIELIMSDTTRSHWMNLLAQTRDAFNMCAQLVTSNDIRLQLVPVHQTCYDTLRKQFPSIPSQGIIRVQKNVLAMLRAIKANKHDSVPSKKSLSLQLDKRLYSNQRKKESRFPTANVDIVRNAHSDSMTRYVSCSTTARPPTRRFSQGTEDCSSPCRSKSHRCPATTTIPLV